MEINNLHDLIGFGIKLHKTDLPNRFIVSVQVPADTRTKIFQEVVDMTKGTPTLVRPEDSTRQSYYSFSMLNMQFHLF